MNASEIQRNKYFSSVSTNTADALRLRDILADERYAQLLNNLRSSPIGHVQRQKRSATNLDENGETEASTVYSTPRKNTKRTKNGDKKTTKFSNFQTSTPFIPSQSIANGKLKVRVV